MPEGDGRDSESEPEDAADPSPSEGGASEPAPEELSPTSLEVILGPPDLEAPTEDFVVVGDVHEGIPFGYRVDPETGVSERSLDFHRNFAAAARWAVDHEVKLFIVAGDLFDRTQVSPAFRELVRKDVVEPLGEAGVKIWLVAGNHDQPRIAARSTSLDDFRGYDHVEVIKGPTVKVMSFGGQEAGFIILPYLHPERLVDMVHERFGEEVPREQAYEFGRKYLREFLRARADELQTARKYFIGHYWIEGARISSSYYREVVPGEFTLTRDMIPEAVDLALLGHIHLHQALGPRVVYAGAPECIDWGEREDPKGFLSVDAGSATWRFHSLPTRPMISLDVDATSGDATERILHALPEDLSGKMVRLQVHLRPGGRRHVDEAALDARLTEAFDAVIRYQEEEIQRTSVVDFSLDPLHLFEEFVTNNFSEDPRYQVIRGEGRRILQEVIP